MDRDYHKDLMKPKIVIGSGVFLLLMIISAIDSLSIEVDVIPTSN